MERLYNPFTGGPIPHFGGWVKLIYEKLLKRLEHGAEDNTK